MKIPHMSMAPPALETPSRFAARTGFAPNASRRSRRARAMRRVVGCALALVALASLLVAYAGPGPLRGLLAQLVRHV